MSTLKTNNIQHVDLAEPSILLNSDGSVSIAGTVSYEDATNVDSVGVVTARKQLHVGTGVSIAAGGLNVTAGISTFGGDVSIADKIIHTGDTDTAIRFSAADTISIETGGVTRATVTGNNIDFPDAGTLRFGASNDLQIYHGTGGASNIIHSNTSQPLIISASGAGTIRFDTNSNERLRITSGGQVGIASAIPRSGFSLDVNGDLTVGESGGVSNSFIDQKHDGDLHLINSGRSSNGVSGNLTGGTGGVAINKFNTRAGGTSLFRDFAVYNGKSTKVLVVDGSAGEVGIGTDDPTGAFEINWNGTSTDMLMLSRPSTGGNFARFGHNTAGGANMLDVRSEGLIRILTGGNNERLRITQDGPHLLLGGTSDVNEITESSANAGIVIGGTSFGNGGLAIINSTSGTGRIYFGDDVGGNAARNRGMIGYYHGSDYMILSTAGSERVRIDSDGDFGVGLTNPTGRLHAQDDRATVTDNLKLRNYKSSVNTKPGLVFEASTTAGQGGNSYIRGLCGADAGGSNSNNDSGMEFEVRQGGTGASRIMLSMRSDGEIRQSGVYKQNGTDANNSAFTANCFYAKTFGPSSVGPGSSVTYNTTNGHATGLVHIFVNRNSNASVNRGIGCGFHLKTTGQANLGSSIYDFTGSGGAPSFTFTQANQGVVFTNNAGYTVTVRGRFELYGSVDG